MSFESPAGSIHDVEIYDDYKKYYRSLSEKYPPEEAERIKQKEWIEIFTDYKYITPIVLTDFKEKRKDVETNIERFIP